MMSVVVMANISATGLPMLPTATAGDKWGDGGPLGMMPDGRHSDGRRLNVVVTMTVACAVRCAADDAGDAEDDDDADDDVVTTAVLMKDVV